MSARLALALFAATSLAACGSGRGGDTADGATYEDATFINDYVEILCGLELRCYEDRSPFDDEAQCQQAAVDVGFPSLGEGCTYDADAAEQCIHDLQSTGCIDCFQVERPASCEQVFEGDCGWPSRDDEARGEG